MKAARNKTIDLSLAEGGSYLERCLALRGERPLPELLDHTLIGDAFELLKLLPERSVDLVVADPPYNLDKDFHGEKFRTMSDGEYASYTESWLSLVLPLLKTDGSFYLCCDWRSTPVLTQVLKKHLILRNRITWQREKGRGAKANWKNAMEDILFATVSENYQFHLDAVRMRRRVIAPYRQNGKPKDWVENGDGKFRDTCPSNFWDDVSVPYWSMAENTAHPTQKPEKLLAKLILASTSPGDLVLDPFSGSGSTLVTAKKLHRHYLGIEQNPRYCIWGEKRLENADADPAIQGYADGVFWERNTARFQHNVSKK